MGATSDIEWTEATWNPTVGCTKVSPGCDHCYAETFVHRFEGSTGFPNPFDQMLLRGEEFLTLPLRWKEPKRIFVNSLSDLFHEDVPAPFIADVFAVMVLAERHTFQLLTKRHGRMRSLLNSPLFGVLLDEALVRRGASEAQFMHPWPIPNVWLGVSVEDQHWADIRIPALQATPAAVRWISAEPLLGLIDLTRHMAPDEFDRTLDWVVAGGESGPRARAVNPNYFRILRDQCATAGIPFLFKQWGNWRPLGPDEPSRSSDVFPDGSRYALMRNVGKRAAGRLLDGLTHDGYPAVQSS